MRHRTSWVQLAPVICTGQIFGIIVHVYVCVSVTLKAVPQPHSEFSWWSFLGKNKRKKKKNPLSVKRSIGPWGEAGRLGLVCDGCWGCVTGKWRRVCVYFYLFILNPLNYRESVTYTVPVSRGHQSSRGTLTRLFFSSLQGMFWWVAAEVTRIQCKLLSIVFDVQP